MKINTIVMITLFGLSGFLFGSQEDQDAFIGMEVPLEVKKGVAYILVHRAEEFKNDTAQVRALVQQCSLSQDHCYDTKEGMSAFIELCKNSAFCDSDLADNCCLDLFDKAQKRLHNDSLNPSLGDLQEYLWHKWIKAICNQQHVSLWITEQDLTLDDETFMSQLESPMSDVQFRCVVEQCKTFLRSSHRRCSIDFFKKCHVMADDVRAELTNSAYEVDELGNQFRLLKFVDRQDEQ